eukprot:4918412-Ditylum_brightwellii.AAC.1
MSTSNSTPHTWLSWSLWGMKQGKLTCKNGDEVFGVNVYEVPTGNGAFTIKSLWQKSTKINDEFSCIETKLYPSCCPEIQLPICQCIWLLTLQCLQHLGNYIYHHVSTNLTESFNQTLDDGIQSLMMIATGINWEELLDKIKEKLCLPIWYCGCGLRQLRDRRYSEYMGGIWH